MPAVCAAAHLYCKQFAEENANTPLDNTHVILRDWHWSTVAVCNKGPRQWPATQPFCVHISELRHWGARNTTATSAVTDINLERQVRAYFVYSYSCTTVVAARRDVLFSPSTVLRRECLGLELLWLRLMLTHRSHSPCMHTAFACSMDSAM
jgi:hypothetical protein